jgi:hypothetical protein
MSGIEVTIRMAGKVGHDSKTRNAKEMALVR